MIYRIFPQKDTFITDVKKNSVPQTGSNFGASEVLDLFKSVGISGAAGFAASASVSRILVQWDLSEVSALTASGIVPSTGSRFFLKMYDERHSRTLPSSYDVQVFPLSRSWDEGVGIDNDTFLDHGVANWDKAMSSVLWTTPGGDYNQSPSATYHFDAGSEDLEVDVTSIVNAWLTGGLPNNGLLLRLSGTHETDGNDYYIKKFHGRSTDFRDRRPTIEMRWDDSLKDDRPIFIFDYTGSLYLYNKRRGRFTNIDGIGTGNNVLTVKITDMSGTIMTVSASHTGRTGIYSASFSLPTGSYSGSVFHDMWGFNGRSFMTGTFYPRGNGGFPVDRQEQYIVTVRNLKKEHEPTEKVRFNLFVRTRSYNPHVVQTGSLVMKNTIIERAYYRVDNATTDQVVIPLGTGALETTRLSYDDDGNYFDFYMSTLAERELYRLIFFFDIDGEFQRIDQDFRFRVV